MKKNEGITLIALVITIIILIILAGVAISRISGEGGMFSKSADVGTKYNIAAKDEHSTTSYLTDMIDKHSEGYIPELPEDPKNGITIATSTEGKKMVTNRPVEVFGYLVCKNQDSKPTGPISTPYALNYALNVTMYSGNIEDDGELLEATEWYDSGKPAFSKTGGEYETLSGLGIEVTKEMLDIAQNHEVSVQMNARATKFPNVPIQQLGQRVATHTGIIACPTIWYLPGEGLGEEFYAGMYKDGLNIPFLHNGSVDGPNFTAPAGKKFDSWKLYKRDFFDEDKPIRETENYNIYDYYESVIDNFYDFDLSKMEDTGILYKYYSSKKLRTENGYDLILVAQWK